VYEYELDHKALNFFSFISARYTVTREEWNGIQLEVYHIPSHSYNVENMLRSMKKSLAYYSENFGPYMHKQARIIEFPRYSSFAQAFAGTMPYSEGIGFIYDLRDVEEDDIDMAFYVVAHEMGHQWWAHQLVGANMRGSEMMSESYAQYSALMVMEKEYGRDLMQKFLRYERDRYLRGRSSETEAERPLMEVERQGYIHYPKGSLVMYYLKEMIGEEEVNAALAELIDEYGYQEPPFPCSVAAVDAFKRHTPDSLQYIITDLFEEITLFSNRIDEVTATVEGDGYRIQMKTITEKFKADSLGSEEPVMLNDYIDIGLFASEGDLKLARPLLLKRLKISGRENEFSFYVDELPDYAGIDPYNYLLDRIPDDNVEKVSAP
jgi:aminopeptidase N